MVVPASCALRSKICVESRSAAFSNQPASACNLSGLPPASLCTCSKCGRLGTIQGQVQAMLTNPSSSSIQPQSQNGDDQSPWEQSPIGAAVEKLGIPWDAVLANLKARGLRLTLRKSRLGFFLLAKARP